MSDQILMYICFAIAAVLFLLGIFLFFRFRIPQSLAYIFSSHQREFSRTGQGKKKKKAKPTKKKKSPPTKRSPVDEEQTQLLGDVKDDDHDATELLDSID